MRHAPRADSKPIVSSAAPPWHQACTDQGASLGAGNGRPPATLSGENGPGSREKIAHRGVRTELLFETKAKLQQRL